MDSTSGSFVSRGGTKLEAGLEAFGIDPNALICADLGASTGGFTDCLLQRGAAKVYSADTAYGQLAWKLRQENRVHVLERTNVLHFDPQTLTDFTGVELVCIDLGWTRQQRAIPVACRWLSGESGRIISLIKPHYEIDKQLLATKGTKGVLGQADAEVVLHQVLETLPDLKVKVVEWIRSPILGGKSGNVEFLALLEPRAFPIQS